MLFSNFHMAPINAFIFKKISQKKVSRPNGLNTYQISYCNSGRGAFLDYKGIRHDILPGDVFFLSPYACHEYYPHEDEPWIITYVTFDGLSGLHEFLKFIGLNNPTTIINSDMFSDGQYIKQLFYQGECEYVEHTPADDFIKHTILYKILFEMYKALNKVTFSQIENDIYSIAPILDYIMRNLKRPFSVKEMCDDLGISKYILYQSFNDTFKTTPSEYILERKLEAAKNMLFKYPDISVSEIATECGFSGSSSFIKHFKEYFNKTPIEYRRQNNYSDSQFPNNPFPIYITNVGENNNQDELFYDNVKDENSFQIMMCTSGTGIFTDHTGKDYFLRPGYMVFISPQASCSYRPSSKPWKISWVRFRGTHLSKFIRILGFDETEVLNSDSVMVYDQRFSSNKKYNFQDVIDKIIRNYYDDSMAAKFANSVLMYELLIFTAIFTEEVINQKPPEELRLAPVIDIINIYYDRNLSNALLADSIGMSEKHMTRLFKAVYRKTPREYITDVRLKHALSLLIKKPNMNISEIAKATGFNTSSYFISVFKKSYNLTPDDYRNLQI